MRKDSYQVCIPLANQKDSLAGCSYLIGGRGEHARSIVFIQNSSIDSKVALRRDNTQVTHNTFSFSMASQKKTLVLNIFIYIDNIWHFI